VNISVDLLRSLFRHLAEWRSVYESDGVDIIYGPDGGYAIQDIEFLYDISQNVLPNRQKQAIRLCLLNNLTEEETAHIMKIDEANPVAMYATSGLETLVHMYKVGILPSRQMFYARQTRYTTADWDVVLNKLEASDPRIAFFVPEDINLDELLSLNVLVEMPSISISKIGVAA
jgi:hypothetical protein